MIQGKASFLLSLPNAAHRLKIFKADLSEEGSFDEAVKGCVGVFHVAASMEFSVEHEEANGNFQLEIHPAMTCIFFMIPEFECSVLILRVPAGFLRAMIDQYGTEIYTHYNTDRKRINYFVLDSVLDILILAFTTAMSGVAGELMGGKKDCNTEIALKHMDSISILTSTNRK
ncbi:hypothetical protein M5K25_018065 [Dendrobium thyrsiflorum]|uniref:3-beta hydroxysteroid dehydrogenase/isomerase domain-containing protein n=1 Tax=Dendrobium thyrsiflorum TaxID=117978 RepID=A0ABD0UHP3_DENTH